MKEVANAYAHCLSRPSLKGSGVHCIAPQATPGNCAAVRCDGSFALILVPFAGSTADVKWESVQVGQVLRVNDDELFPADLMCLYTALPDKASPLAGTKSCSLTCGPSIHYFLALVHTGPTKGTDRFLLSGSTILMESICFCRKRYALSECCSICMSVSGEHHHTVDIRVYQGSYTTSYSVLLPRAAAWGRQSADRRSAHLCCFTLTSSLLSS